MQFNGPNYLISLKNQSHFSQTGRLSENETIVHVKGLGMDRLNTERNSASISTDISSDTSKDYNHVYEKEHWWFDKWNKQYIYPGTFEDADALLQYYALQWIKWHEFGDLSRLVFEYGLSQSEFNLIKGVEYIRLEKWIVSILKKEIFLYESITPKEISHLALMLLSFSIDSKRNVNELALLGIKVVR